MDLTLGRLLQIRSVILQRRKEDARANLRLEEIKLRALMSSIHGAAGNKRGARQAAKFKLIKSDPAVPRMESVIGKFGADEDGLITPEQIAERRREMGLD